MNKGTDLVLDLRAYRLGFIPVLAAIVLLAFSLRGVPEALEPPVGTIEFDAERAASATRDLARAAPEREPGSDGAARAADWVRQRLEDVGSGTVAEQRFEASVDGDDVELRNLLLTLRGADNRAILIVAERSSRGGAGVATSAAATGVLVELAAELAVSGRERTLILASIEGGVAEGQGVSEMLDALPEAQAIDAAVVISQPGASELAEPHLVTSSGGEERPSLELIRTAEDALADRGQVDAGLEGPLGQIARQAIPAAAGAQAALLTEGIDAVAVSSAGEVPLAAGEAGAEELAVDSLERFGATALALVGALDARLSNASSPGIYLRVGDNTLPGWAVSLLALSLLAPPALPVALHLTRARRDGTAAGALGWAVEWAIAGLAPLLALLVLSLGGLIPGPHVPYDPGSFGIGATEVFALLVLAGTGMGAWWTLGLRRAPPLGGATLGAAAGAVCLAACSLAWLVNPFLALVLAPLAHLVVIHASSGRRPAVLALPATLVAVVPIAAALLHVAAALDWGPASPWQLVVLVAGNGLDLIAAGSIAVALAATVAVVDAAQRAPGPRVGAEPQAPSRVRP